MLQRCVLRCQRRPPFNAVHTRTSLQSLSRRHASSTSERARKLPGNDGAFKLKSWQRTFLIGTVAGLIFGQAWLFYDRRTLRDSFVTYKLTAKEAVSPTASIFYLEPKGAAGDVEKYQDAFRKGIWNFQFKQPQIQIVRAYTPLPPQTSQDEDLKSLRFLIRHDQHGEMSNYLHRLQVGADIDMRGPNLEYQLSPDIQQVVFFAGGTGIAPALQIAHAMFNSNTGQADKKRKLHILWASRKREDCLGGVSDAPVTENMPPKATWSGLFTKQKEKPTVKPSNEKGPIVQELENLKTKYPGQVTVEYFVNSEGTWIDEETVFRSLSRFDDKDFSTGFATSSEQRQVLISGPSGFISYLAGPKEWRNGKEEQGNVSKILAHAIAQNPHHVKVWKI